MGNEGSFVALGLKVWKACLDVPGAERRARQGTLNSIPIAYLDRTRTSVSTARSASSFRSRR
jgi:hypothetical protein